MLGSSRSSRGGLGYWTPFVAILCLVLVVACGEEANVEGQGNDDRQVEIPRDPGTVSLHRLNRAEYNNTVRDLLGTNLRPADDFPADDLGYGFDNIADVLSLSPLHLELYQRAAEQLIAEAMALPATNPTTYRFQAEDVEADVGALYRDDFWNLWSGGGGLWSTVDLPVGGDFIFTVRAYGQQAGPDPTELGVFIDEASVATIVVAAVEAEPGVYEVDLTLTAGTHRVEIRFLNDYYDPPDQDSNLVVDWFTLEGPTDITWAPSESRDAIMICAPADSSTEECGRQILSATGGRAWRRPLTEAELDNLMGLVNLALDEDDLFETGISLALEAMLVSPHFIFRVETDANLDDVEPHFVSDYELASRLSYFLWSSMPDQELMDLAEAAQLQNPEEIERQVLRMLQDPRSRALVDNFGAQWLYVRDVQNVFPDIWVFPEFDEELRRAMITEMGLFFETFITEDRDMRELLTSNESFINARLADHYGLTGDFGDEFQRFTFSDEPRRGVLTQAGILTVLSTPTRTSLVRRGKWVLSQLLCSAPPPPPPGVEGLPVDEGDDEPGSLREQFQRHREDPDCASCHDAMDNIGFGLENYDGIGLYRVSDSGGAIDSNGVLPDGRSFSNALELAEIVANDPAYSECLTEKLFTYAIGRGPGFYDTPYLINIDEAFANGGYRFSGLAVQIALSEPFRFRRARTEREDTVDNEESVSDDSQGEGE